MASASGYFHPQIYRVKYRAYSVKVIAYDSASALDAFRLWLRDTHKKERTPFEIHMGSSCKSTLTVNKSKDTVIVAVPKFA